MCEDDVLEFEVSMQHSLRVHVRYAAGEFAHYD